MNLFYLVDITMDLTCYLTILWLIQIYIAVYVTLLTTDHDPGEVVKQIDVLTEVGIVEDDDALNDNETFRAT